MKRKYRKELTRNEIIRVAVNSFLKEGYSKTTFGSISKTLKISPGNITFHFNTKEYLLAELVDMLCKYQRKRMDEETKEGNSSVMAICLELLTIASACEQDEVVKEFFLASYMSPLSMEIIRKSDKERAKEAFEEYCQGWREDQFTEAGILVSGIEYSILLTTETTISLEKRIAGALNAILNIYNVPEETRKLKIEKVLAMNYKEIGLKVLEEFRGFVEKETEQTLQELLTKNLLNKNTTRE